MLKFTDLNINQESKGDTATDYTNRIIGKCCTPVTEQSGTEKPDVIPYLTFIWQTS